MGDRGTFTLEATGMPHMYYPKKYFINASDEAPFGDPNPNGYSNDRVIRYADVLIFGAEAAYYVGDEALARQLTNIVSARARNNNSSILPNLMQADGASAVGCHSARTPCRIGLEGHRFFDLVRQGRAAEELAEFGFTAGVNEVFPIPKLKSP